MLSVYALTMLFTLRKRTAVILIFLLTITKNEHQKMLLLKRKHIMHLTHQHLNLQFSKNVLHYLYKLCYKGEDVWAERNKQAL